MVRSVHLDILDGKADPKRRISTSLFTNLFRFDRREIDQSIVNGPRMGSLFTGLMSLGGLVFILTEIYINIMSYHC